QARKPLADWLQNELTCTYYVPRKIAEHWIKSDQVLPLLDGLDEVTSHYRVACVRAINEFRQSHGFLPIVITSRTAEYESIAEALWLQSAILVRPITKEQVGAYLAELGSEAQAVRAAIEADPSLWELLDSPLTLNVVTLAYVADSTAPFA